MEKLDRKPDSNQESVSPSNDTGHEMTFGEKLVGLTFNPSNDDKVSKAKRLCADLADLVNEHFYEDVVQKDLPVGLKHKLFEHTIGEILNAQMNVVKVLTLK